jgi:hypothetical protein
MAASIGCDEQLIDETPAVLGIGHPVTEFVDEVTATVIGPTGREIDLPLRIAPDVVPGLTLVAPLRGATFAAGIYRFVERRDSIEIPFTVCLGTSPFSG